ncbi:hypothetical protein FA10DRAFT_268916 [Acaromyces ingoldii]|uniref:Uncharacterized protein n=1 Tax=Acaromyces ingoldii TaxID=215250 RepID=A0A316YHX5_9BASI|nr:hypothetical protein FA10DRAFT_268916 [Acaromyces ingoldii]PWN88772.1 hypothetical protein FA10DRAFT_268916 [Acaromyces ingoldii]
MVQSLTSTAARQAPLLDPVGRAEQRALFKSLVFLRQCSSVFGRLVIPPEAGAGIDLTYCIYRADQTWVSDARCSSFTPQSQQRNGVDVRGYRKQCRSACCMPDHAALLGKPPHAATVGMWNDFRVCDNRYVNLGFVDLVGIGLRESKTGRRKGSPQPITTAPKALWHVFSRPDQGEKTGEFTWEGLARHTYQDPTTEREGLHLNHYIALRGESESVPSNVLWKTSTHNGGQGLLLALTAQPRMDLPAYSCNGKQYLYVLTLYDAETGALLRSAIPPDDLSRPDLPARSRLRLTSEQRVRSDEVQCYACVASTQMICFQPRAQASRLRTRQESAGNACSVGVGMEMETSAADASSAVSSDGSAGVSQELRACGEEDSYGTAGHGFYLEDFVQDYGWDPIAGSLAPFGDGYNFSAPQDPQEGLTPFVGDAHATFQGDEVPLLDDSWIHTDTATQPGPSQHPRGDTETTRTNPFHAMDEEEEEVQMPTGRTKHGREGEDVAPEHQEYNANADIERTKRCRMEEGAADDDAGSSSRAAGPASLDPSGNQPNVAPGVAPAAHNDIGAGERVHQPDGVSVDAPNPCSDARDMLDLGYATDDHAKDQSIQTIQQYYDTEEEAAKTLFERYSNKIGPAPLFEDIMHKAAMRTNLWLSAAAEEMGALHVRAFVAESDQTSELGILNKDLWLLEKIIGRLVGNGRLPDASKHMTMTSAQRWTQAKGLNVSLEGIRHRTVGLKKQLTSFVALGCHVSAIADVAPSRIGIRLDDMESVQYLSNSNLDTNSKTLKERCFFLAPLVYLAATSKRHLRLRSSDVDRVILRPYKCAFLEAIQAHKVALGDKAKAILQDSTMLPVRKFVGHSVVSGRTDEVVVNVNEQRLFRIMLHCYHLGLLIRHIVKKNDDTGLVMDWLAEDDAYFAEDRHRVFFSELADWKLNA